MGIDLLCTGCRRLFVPAEDGIISALPARMDRSSANKEQLQAVIDAAGPGEQGQSVVLYEQAFHDAQAPYYDSISPIRCR